MLQYSIYVRHCATGENADVHFKRVENIMPVQGTVSILTVTDKQYSMMVTYWGNELQAEKASPAQLELF